MTALRVGLDTKNTVITSPLSSLVTYNVDDCLTIIVVHGRRHFGQAERVTAMTEFPS